MKESSDYIIKGIQATLADDIENTDKFVDLILGARKIFLYGVGRSGLIAKSFAIRLVQMGLEVFFVGETVTPIVEEGNVVIIVSYTGETMSAIQTANIVRRVAAKVVAITANGHSKLGSASNLVIELNPPKDEERKRLAPLGTLFEDATMVYLDSIVATLMEKLGQSEKGGCRPKNPNVSSSTNPDAWPRKIGKYICGVRTFSCSLITFTSSLVSTGNSPAMMKTSPWIS